MCFFSNFKFVYQLTFDHICGYSFRFFFHFIHIYSTIFPCLQLGWVGSRRDWGPTVSVREGKLRLRDAEIFRFDLLQSQTTQPSWSRKSRAPRVFRESQTPLRIRPLSHHRPRAFSRSGHPACSGIGRSGYRVRQQGIVPSRPQGSVRPHLRNLFLCTALLVQSDSLFLIGLLRHTITASDRLID